MKIQGIQTSIHYPPIHTFQAYRDGGYPFVDLSRTEAFAAREVTLPLYPGLTDANILEVSQAVAFALGHDQT